MLGRLAVPKPEMGLEGNVDRLWGPNEFCINKTMLQCSAYTQVNRLKRLKVMHEAMYSVAYWRPLQMYSVVYWRPLQM